MAWDPAKALSNLAQHGVSFDQAATVLLDPLALTVIDVETARPSTLINELLKKDIELIEIGH